MMFFSIPNLTSIAATPCPAPWEFNKTPPDNVRKDKAARDTWANAVPDWNCYSAVEGLNSNRRVTADTGDDSNPPYRLHAFVADFDLASDDEKVLRAIENFPYKPTHFERTLSGNVRFLFPFAEPMKVPSDKFLKFFLREILSDFPVDKMLAGFDKGAWCEPNRYYTNSGDWKVIDGAEPIPAERVRGWVLKFGSKFGWVKENEAAEIPFDVLRPALEAKYPRFSEWPGDFSLGEQGPSFWIDDSTSPKSAIVRETGIQTFSAHASRAFYSWSDLLGPSFVKDYQSDIISKAVEGIYFDLHRYHYKLPNGAWSKANKNDILDHLRISRGLSSKFRKEFNSSDLDRAAEYIRQHQQVQNVGPFMFQPTGLLEYNGALSLNTYTRQVLQPSGKPETWGEKGDFPWISYFLDNYLSTPIQLDFLLSHSAIFYRSGYYQKPTSGHNIFISGPVGRGKSLFTQQIMGPLVGGVVDANAFITGTETFSGHLFHYAMWAIDDPILSGRSNGKQFLTEISKKMAADRNHRANVKFEMPYMVPWQGRIYMTLNNDAWSVRALPELGAGIMDKIIILLVSSKPFKFPPSEELHAILKRELPHFAQFLLDYQIPEHCLGDSRFLLKAYHEPSLVQTAEQSSSTAGFLEILMDWKEDHFKHNADEHWEGSATQLVKEFSATTLAGSALLKNLTAEQCGKQLSVLQTKGYNLDWRQSRGVRRWRIYKQDRTANEQYAELVNDSESE